MDRIVSLLPSLPKLYLEALNPNVTVFGNRVFKEVIKLNEVVGGGALIRLAWCFYKKRKRQ